MNTLLICLAGPMQSWGVQSRFSVRDSGLEPSKSGVIGLLCAALGRSRSLAIDDLACLRMGVRVDREGQLRRDYHIAQAVLKAGGGIKPTEPSTRYYLADAVFLAALEGSDLALLQQIQNALIKPVWPLYLGRKAFVPSRSIALEDGLKPGIPLLEALESYPCVVESEAQHRTRLVIENPLGENIRNDQPASFSERKFFPRHVSIHFQSSPPVQKEVD